jgi:hypothetical protein
MKKFIRRLIEKAGYTVFKTAYAPKQMDVILDIRRLVPLSSVQVIFDVGANVGETVLLVSGSISTRSHRGLRAGQGYLPRA